MAKKGAVLQFPGSNRENDAINAVVAAGGQKPDLIWHEQTSLNNVDYIIIPGGFSYGDYLRCGAMAARAPIMNEVIRHAKRGVPVLGICNGFQILTECGLLPGGLLRNKDLRFVCRYQSLTIANHDNMFLSNYKPNQKVTYAIAHGDGNYFADDDTLRMLHDSNRVALYYDADSNPNGSVDNIAGVFSADFKVLGMMPHPENAIDKTRRDGTYQGHDDGLALFQAILN